MFYETEAMQHPDEISVFADLLKLNTVQSYLEIGSKFGGSFWQIGLALGSGAKLVAVDKPNGTHKWKESSLSLQSCVGELRVRGRHPHIVWGDSKDPVTIQNVKALGPFDAVFIDANHTTEYLLSDWENYGPMARIVAFHDIAWWRAPEWKEGTRIQVPEFWNEIKKNYRHQEIKLDSTRKNNGIGVLWTC